MIGLMWAGTASAQASFESRVLDALNELRADPAGYARSLAGFKHLFHASYYVVPGRNERVLTEEGVGAVDDAINFLQRQRSVEPVASGTLLSEAAADHVAYQHLSREIGHADGDGSGPGDRMRRRGGGEEVAEVIAYGATDAADVVRQLIVDDGVPERDHRAILFDPHLHFAGVSCGPHPVYRTMCVIDMAVNSDGFGDDVPLRSLTYGH